MKIFFRLIEIVFDEKATASELLVVVVGMAIFWAIFFTLTTSLIRPLVYNKPWLVAAGERDYERGGRDLYEKLGMSKTKQDFVQAFMNMWPYMIGIIIQHLVGGALCLSSILGIGDPKVAASLAALGILSEMGWEIEDILSWTIKRFGLADGKAHVPSALLIMLTIHHSLTTILGVPTVLHYRSLKTLHWICFDLQAAAASSLAITEYTKMLDVSKPSQLVQFQVLTFVALIIMLWTRCIHWVYLCGKFVLVWYQDEAWGFLVLGTFFALVFSGFNWVFCIQPFYARFVKFLKVSAKYSALPVDATPQQRRSSTSELEKAAADIFARHALEEELAAMFADRKIERRSTLPASMFRRKRPSLALLRSSAGDHSRIISQLNDELQREVAVD